MRRHGWALCLGLFTGLAVAGPPSATGERYPPAPAMPGEVIAQSPGTRPGTPTTSPRTKTPAIKPAQAVSEAPLPPAPPAPHSTSINATVAPSQPCPTSAPPATGFLSPPGSSPAQYGAAWSEGHGSCQEWLSFRSRARQSGHYPTPYYPPLLAWFPCEPRPGAPCGLPGGPACQGGPTCAGAPTGHPVPPGPPVGELLPGEGPMGVRKVGEGITFAPGGAPMANPTTQVTPRREWKPK